MSERLLSVRRVLMIGVIPVDSVSGGINEGSKYLRPMRRVSSIRVGTVGVVSSWLGLSNTMTGVIVSGTVLAGVVVPGMMDSIPFSFLLDLLVA